MPERTDITVQETLGRYPALPLVAGSAELEFEAGDAANGNAFTMTGREIVIARNDDELAQTITVASVVDKFNRTGDITAYSIPAGEYAILGPIPMVGFVQTTGKCHINVSDAGVFLAVVRIPE